ncbi:MAG: hypothetical protein AB1626_03525 [Candidatus Micrarchaeota archaeon]
MTFSRRYLLPARHEIEELDPAKPTHFHHLAEIARRRIELQKWFDERKKALRVSVQEVDMARLAARSGGEAAKALLVERDEKIVHSVLDLAEVCDRRARAAVIGLARQMRESTRSIGIEEFFFLRTFKEGLAGLMQLTPLEKTRVSKAYSDWLKAMQLFGKTGKQIF